MKKLKLIILASILCSCSVSALAVWPTKAQCDSVVDAFRRQANLNGFTLDTYSDFRWVDTACLRQGGGGYFADQWYPVLLRKGDTLVGGIPGQSAYYTISAHFYTFEGDTAAYWDALQVPPHATHGYRIQVAYYVVKNDNTIALIGKALNNGQHGGGGAWQFYVPDYSNKLNNVGTKNFVP